MTTSADPPTAAAELEPYLRPSRFIDSDAEPIVARARSLAAETPAQTAVALFNWVRDEISYNPLAAVDGEEQYRASAVLARGSGYCVQKAVLLAALARAAQIPTRLGFADVRNHQVPPRLREMMGTDLFVFHGYVELHLEASWVKAAPAFDAEASRKAGVLPVELDGTNDAMLHPVDPRGHPYIEYVRSRGSYVDVPYEELQRALLETYSDTIQAFLKD